MFEIIYILLEKEKVTAKELSEKFEVSIRTIYRDIESISAAGIPVYMSKGKGGGISLLPKFTLNKSVFSEEEKNYIISALKGFASMKVDDSSQALSKITSFFGENNREYIEIDPMEWGNKINDAYVKSKQAIISKHILVFDYVSTDGTINTRRVEPYVLWFKAHTWYLKSFCLDKNEQRLFRLSRMRNVKISPNSYIPRIIESFHVEENTKTPTTIILAIDKCKGRRVYDEFLESEISVKDDGNFEIKTDVILDDWVVGNILSYGSSAFVISPLSLRNTIKNELKKSIEKYI